MQEGRDMNKRVIVYVLGAVLLIEAALMLLPLLVAVIYREKNGWYFLWVLLCWARWRSVWAAESAAPCTRRRA